MVRKRWTEMPTPKTHINLNNFVYPFFRYFFSRNSSTFSAYKTKLTLTDFCGKLWLNHQKKQTYKQDRRSGSKEYLTKKCISR